MNLLKNKKQKILNVRIFVSNETSNVLSIKVVDEENIRLPGGPINSNEEPAEAACRYLQDQTGISAMRQDLITIHHEDDIICYYAPRAFGNIRMINKSIIPEYNKWNLFLDRSKESSLNNSVAKNILKKFPCFSGKIYISN